LQIIKPIVLNNVIRKAIATDVPIAFYIHIPLETRNGILKTPHTTDIIAEIAPIIIL